MKKEDYTVPSKCHVCEEKFLARYNVASRAKVCTPPTHTCRPGKKDDEKIRCLDKCCRSKYQRGVAAAIMDSAIDPRKVLSDDELEETLKASKGLENPAGITLRFIAETGCRLGEAFLIRKESLQWQQGSYSVVKIPTLKRAGRPLRSVHLNNKGPHVPELRKWASRLEAGATLFDIPRRSLQHALERILRKVKPDRASLVHIFRHTRASRLLAAGADMAYVRQQLGWSSLELLKIYAHTSEEKITGVLARL